ncbi:PUB3, partial [Symbiodinium sp. CCMP2456]
MADTSSWLEAMATPPPRPEPKKPARPSPPPKAETDQGADWTPPAQKWQRTGKGKKGQKGQKGGKKGNKGAGKGQERQRRQDEQRRDQAWDDSWWASSSWSSGYDWETPGRDQGGKGEKKRANARRSIIVLSAFDGIGASHWLVAKAFGRPLLAVSWEVDRACKALVQKAMPWVEHRGDFTRDSPKDVADLIVDADPDALALIVWCAAPPCQDFSRIGQGEGHLGDRGRLFQDAVEFMHELRAQVPKHRFGFLYENVDMDRAAAQVISDGLGVRPIFACPSDFGWVSRPRLWWTSVDWTRFQVDPDDGTPLEWAKKGRWERLRLASARPSADTFDLGGLAFHPAVATGRRLMPCATTPAPTDEGRPKPRATRGKTSKDTDARWSEGNRQYAPWHYQLEAMLQDSQGVLHLPTAEIKEQLHGIPTGYTAQAGADDRTSTLRWLTQAWAGRPWDFSPPPRPPPPVLGEGLDMGQHWASAPLMQHSLTRRPELEPALAAVIHLRRQWRHDLCRIRREVVAEILALVEEREDDTRAWLQELPAHVRATYTTSDRPRPFQGPTFLGLLRDLGYPATADLEEDLRLGFDMLGPVRRAPGWKPRVDGRYSNPSSMDRLRQENPPYVAAKCSRGRSGVHTTALLDELVQEARLGRVIGPCAAPDHWSVAASALPWTADMHTLRRPPLGDCFAALSFAICQIDENGELKLRRGEDWRRSGHNATMSAEDVPTRHFLGDIVDFILAAWHEGWDPKVFGHDLQNAYRQWAVRFPGHCGTFLPTDQGVTLCFGAAASVWNFNRAADAVQMLMRALLLVLLGHFVDDFNGADDNHTADSAHYAVAELFAALGLQTKPSKAQTPDKEHIVQGVQLHIGAEGVWLSPTEERRRKILAQIDESTFGCTGRAAIKPLYSRAADTAANSADALSVGLRAALSALRRLVGQSRPRLVPWPGRVRGPFPVLYADAFFLDGDLRRKPGHIEPGDNVPQDARWRNGWGFVLLLGDHVFYDFGVIKPELLTPFAARKAFIY